MATSNVIYTNPHFCVLQDKGISKSMLRYVMQNQFSINSGIVQNALKEYYFLYCEPDYFFSQIHEGIYKGYQVIYKDSLSTLRKECQIALSFREADKRYNLEKYVLVRKGNK